MEAGRELDALVAENVMGWLPPRGVRTWWGLPGATGGYRSPPAYSTNIVEAWKVVEWLRRQRSNFSMGAANGWGVHAWDVDYDMDTGTMNDYANPINGHADTAPHAICLAALKAVGVEV